MYAVIATGGKQYRVEEGDSLRVERLEAEEGPRSSSIGFSSSATVTRSPSADRSLRAAR